MAAKKTTVKKTTTTQAVTEQSPPSETSQTPKESRHHIEIVHGVGGYSIYLNGFRIVGQKPWGGGRSIAEWKFSEEDLQRAVNMKE